MRLVSGVIALVLLLIAAIGIGFGVWAVVKAASIPGAGGAGLLTALTIGGIPFIAGTVALAGAGVMFVTGQVRDELEIARADRETLAARDVAHRRLDRQRDPAFQAQVEAVKAEQAAAKKSE